MSSKSPFKVIIVGGGIAGLSLANMLERVDIDYVVLEAREDIHPPQGAGIGLMPNGSFIMDQLGCYEAIKAAAEDAQIEDAIIRDSAGKPLVGMKYLMYHQEKRHGYPMLFFDRQLFLKVLYEQVKYKDRILVGNRVNRIELLEDGVTVITEEGLSYTGNIVIGADGIHSRVRKEMRRIAESIDSKYFDPLEEDQVPCYYQCSFGIAQDVEGWPGSEQGFTTGCGKSFLIVSGPAGRVYWFLFVKFPEPLYGKNIPRYSREDEAQFVRENEGLVVRDGLTFGQLYAKRVNSALTPLHEVVFKKWFFDRIITMGDSAHKPNPIGGMGANGAIETAAEFINALVDTRENRENGLDGLTLGGIRSIFERVQNTRDKRARFTVSSSHQVQALIGMENPIVATFVLRVLVPLAGKHSFPRDVSDRVVGAARLKHLDLPSRPRVVPYEHELPAEPLASLPSSITRTSFCLFLALLVFASRTTVQISLDNLDSELELVSWGSKWFTISEVPVSKLSNLVSSVASSKMTLIYLFSNMLSPLVIYTVEGSRIGRQGSLIGLPLLFIIGLQIQGIKRSTLSYALINTFHSPQGTVDRSVPLEVAKSLIPALALGIILPTVLLVSFAPSTDNWQTWIQVFPLLYYALNIIFRTALRFWQPQNSTEDPERHTEWYSTRDIPFLNITYDLVFALQTALHLSTAAFISFSTSLSIADVLWSILFGQRGLELAIPSEQADCIPRNELLWTAASVICHSLYSVWELRRQGYITTMIALRAASAVFLGQFLVGPGASWVAVYRWRENVIFKLSSPSSL
ncbi:FAD/NAD(P)-binding domain-containing protein [Xylariaceae sp. AK1471]|nr:FAD/NAD(P)-binding domain-containing protein [Xylariaceae sp. AK1471]